MGTIITSQHLGFINLSRGLMAAYFPRFPYEKYRLSLPAALNGQTRLMPSYYNLCWLLWV